jgi:uncharacterized protein YndB with AHSA1/START domain
MEQKTKVHAEEGKHDVQIVREFELPVDLLFKAYAEADLLSQWMGTKVLRLDSKKNGSYQFETADPQGNPVFKANGVIHEFVPDRKITRTFEMANVPFGVQLEFYEFEPLSADSSRLKMHVLYESVEQRDQAMKFGLAWGLNMALDRLQEVVSKTKK